MEISAIKGGRRAGAGGATLSGKFKISIFILNPSLVQLDVWVIGTMHTQKLQESTVFIMPNESSLPYFP